MIITSAPKAWVDCASSFLGLGEVIFTVGFCAERSAVPYKQDSYRHEDNFLNHR